VNASKRQGWQVFAGRWKTRFFPSKKNGVAKILIADKIGFARKNPAKSFCQQKSGKK